MIKYLVKYSREKHHCGKRNVWRSINTENMSLTERILRSGVSTKHKRGKYEL